MESVPNYFLSGVSGSRAKILNGLWYIQVSRVPVFRVLVVKYPKYSKIPEVNESDHISSIILSQINISKRRVTYIETLYRVGRPVGEGDRVLETVIPLHYRV